MRRDGDRYTVKLNYDYNCLQSDWNQSLVKYYNPEYLKVSYRSLD